MSRCAVALLSAGLLLAACGGDSGDGPRNTLPTTPVSAQVATVVVSPETSLLTVGDSLRLAASTRDVGGAALTGRVVAWSSDAPAIATVSQAGVVTARAAGLARITALSEGRSGTATITAVR